MSEHSNYWHSNWTNISTFSTANSPITDSWSFYGTNTVTVATPETFCKELGCYLPTEVCRKLCRKWKVCKK